VAATVAAIVRVGTQAAAATAAVDTDVKLIVVVIRGPTRRVGPLFLMKTVLPCWLFIAGSRQSGAPPLEAL
jgi:hypothetical protein